MGTALAYVLVRFRFPGRRVLSSVVDLPLAIPTLVTGSDARRALRPERADRRGSSTARHPGRLHADRRSSWPCCVVTLPLVVRQVQPVLQELDPAEEEAAATLGASAWTVVPPGRAPGAPSGDRRGSAADVRPLHRRVRQRGPRLRATSPGETLTAPVFIFQLAEPVPAGGGRGGRDADVRDLVRARARHRPAADQEGEA